MQIAEKFGIRITPSPGASAICPSCREEVIAKCGVMNVWHWAHKVADCDPWHEPESLWHKTWKSYFPLETQEFVMGNHRADVKIGNWVIEFQKSSISYEEIQERERHYGQMIWVVCAHDWVNNLSLRDKGGYLSFRWKHPRKSWWAATKPILFDLRPYQFLFKIEKLYPNIPCGGWGREVPKRNFIDGLTEAQQLPSIPRYLNSSSEQNLYAPGCE